MQSPGPVNSKKRIPETTSTRGSALNHFDLLLRSGPRLTDATAAVLSSARACCSAERKPRLLAHGMPPRADIERDPHGLLSPLMNCGPDRLHALVSAALVASSLWRRSSVGRRSGQTSQERLSFYHQQLITWPSSFQRGEPLPWLPRCRARTSYRVGRPE